MTYFVTWRLRKSQQPLKSEERDTVKSAICYFDGDRYQLYAWVVMDDHCHALVTPLKEHQLKDIMYSWKSFSAYRLQREFGRQGTVWRNESFDRIVRNDAELYEKANYIVNNPRKRWPDLENYPWVWFVGSE